MRAPARTEPGLLMFFCRSSVVGVHGEVRLRSRCRRRRRRGGRVGGCASRCQAEQRREAESWSEMAASGRSARRRGALLEMRSVACDAGEAGLNLTQIRLDADQAESLV